MLIFLPNSVVAIIYKNGSGPGGSWKVGPTIGTVIPPLSEDFYALVRCGTSAKRKSRCSKQQETVQTRRLRKNGI